MLNGSLESFALPDVLRFVASGGISGRISITREEVAGELAVHEGRFVGASLADADLPSSADEALDATVLLFDGSGGTFDVKQGDPGSGPFEHDADQLIAAVDERRRQWAELVEVLGSLDEPLALVDAIPDGTDQITISRKDWHLLCLVDGSRSVQDIAADAGTSIYAAAATLATLARAGLVAAGTWDEAADSDDAEDPQEMLRELASDDDDGAPAKPKKGATVRPLRVPTREEQRVKLRR